MKIGCQTYTWEMLGDGWRGRVTDILDWVAAAGYDGVEITNTMIREFRDQPREFLAELARRNMRLATFAYATTGFTDVSRRKADLDGADHALRFLAHFPGVQLGLGGAASEDQSDRRGQLDHALTFYNEVGRRAHDAGIVVNVHPHSHFGSLLETAEEYDYLLAHLDPVVRFGPDTGHIVRGGQDLLECLRRCLPRISHLHLKDADAQNHWQPMGQGVCDLPGVFALLAEAGYSGWVVCEEESALAREDGVAAIRHNRGYLRSLGL